MNALPSKAFHASERAVRQVYTSPLLREIGKRGDGSELIKALDALFDAPKPKR
ncbi:MAG: hypothetical protein ABIT16_04195 [Croceibacterium sp.]